METCAYQVCFLADTKRRYSRKSRFLASFLEKQVDKLTRRLLKHASHRVLTNLSQLLHVRVDGDVEGVA